MSGEKGKGKKIKTETEFAKNKRSGYYFISCLEGTWKQARVKSLIVTVLSGDK